MMAKLADYWRKNRKWITSAAIGLAGTLVYILGPSSKWTIIITAVLTSFGVWRVPNDRAQPVVLASAAEGGAPPPGEPGVADAGAGH